MRRSLSLKREALAPLSTDELSYVAGGSHLCGTGHGPSFDQACPTVDAECPSNPVRGCLPAVSGPVITLLRTIDCPTR